MQIERKIDITISDISAEEVATLFWSMDDYEQARFFNHLGTIPAYKLVQQLQSLTDNGTLNREGRRVMLSMGDYATVLTDLLKEAGRGK